VSLPRPLALAMVMAALARLTYAQTREEPVMARVLVRRLERMLADPSVRHLTTASTPLELMRASPIGDLSRLDDSSLVRYTAAFGAILDAAPESVCAHLWDPQQGVTSSAFLEVAASADSVHAEGYVDLVERLVWAGLRSTPPGRRATARQVQDAVARLTTALPSSERRRLERLNLTTGSTLGERCFFVRSTFHRLQLLRPSEAGPLLRAFYGGP
jgi:hypothetical protein